LHRDVERQRVPSTVLQRHLGRKRDHLVVHGLLRLAQERDELTDPAAKLVHFLDRRLGPFISKPDHQTRVQKRELA
jgi:hypothetical protein